MPLNSTDGFPHPENPNVPIWRYMDFTKFVSLLDSGALFFARADCLGDPFEGSRTQADLKERARIFSEKGVPAEWVDHWGRGLEDLRQSTFISCWHMNEHESAAMWKLYAQTNEAIAVRSTYAHLRDLLDEPGEEFRLAPVKYIDFQNDLMTPDSLLSPFFHKRRSFEHEREVRAMVQWIATDSEQYRADPTWREGACLVELDLTKLIQSVYVAPSSPAWFRPLIHSVIKRYGYNFDVHQSSLDDAPLF